jgi:hypothetical protein
MAATVSARRQALADLVRTRKGEGASGRLATRLGIVLIVLCLLGLAVAWCAGFFTTPQEVLAVRTAVDTEIAQFARVARGEIPFSENTGSFGPLMEVARQVPDQYRDQTRRELGRLFEARDTAEINSFFALPPAQRAAELDRRIKAEEARRARWEAERQEREPSRGDAGGGASDGARSDQARATPQGQRRGGSRTEESRNNWAKRSIDRTTAEGRARRTEYRRAKDQRRIALGFQPRS